MSATRKFTPEQHAAVRRSVGASASMTAQQVTALITDPPVGTPLHAELKRQAIERGLRCGAIAAGREAAWRDSCDRDINETVASLARAARAAAGPDVAAAANAEIGLSTHPARVLKCFADATAPETVVVASAAPVVAAAKDPAAAAIDEAAALVQASRIRMGVAPRPSSLAAESVEEKFVRASRARMGADR
jgi:hypothetical protein